MILPSLSVPCSKVISFYKQYSLVSRTKTLLPSTETEKMTTLAWILTPTVINAPSRWDDKNVTDYSGLPLQMTKQGKHQTIPIQRNSRSGPVSLFALLW